MRQWRAISWRAQHNPRYCQLTKYKMPAMSTSSDFSGFPVISYTEEHQLTQPTPLHEQPKLARIGHQLAVITEQHPHIVRIIRILWGHKECLKYIKQLVFDGGDGVGRSRIGFKQEVLSALIDLSNLHEIVIAEPPTADSKMWPSPQSF